jgi:hypothetical protein
MDGLYSTAVYAYRLWLVESKWISLFHIGIPQEFGPPFFVFLACDLSGGISLLQELQRRLHLPVGSPPHRKVDPIVKTIFCPQ